MVAELTFKLSLIDNHLQAEFIESGKATGEYIDLKECEKRGDDLTFLGHLQNDYINWKQKNYKGKRQIFEDDDEPF